jgi:PTH1 family peptidyl-tRNA hydrolase
VRRLRLLLQRLLTRAPETPKASSSTILLIGLRNPGSRYEGTRHNIGGDAVAMLAERLGASFRSAPRGIAAEIADGRLDDAPIRLARPKTFMNESGQAVGGLLRYFRPETYLIAHDDIDLAYGTMRVHHGRGSGGHNGIRSVAATLGTTEFWRLRIGVGRPPGRMDPADFVLQRFRPDEDADVLVQEAADVLAAFIRGGEEAARQTAGERNDR